MTTPTRRVGRLWALAVVATFVVACSGASTPAPSPAASSEASALASPSAAASPSPAATASPAASGGLSGETGMIEVLGTGFAITIPGGWRAFALDEAGVAAIARQFPPDLQIGQLLSGQMANLTLAGVRLFAVDAKADAVAEGGVPTLNVIVQQRPPGLSIQLLGMLAKSQLEGLDAVSDVTVSDVELPAGPAVRASYELAQAMADGSSVSAVARQYYLASEDSLFIVTMTGSVTAADTLDPIFDAMAESITLD